MSGDGILGTLSDAFAKGRRTLRVGLIVVGLVSLLLALAIALVPWLVPSFVVDALLAPVLANTGLVLFGGIALVTLVFFDLVASADEDPEPSVSIPTAPGAVETDRSAVDTPGDWVDERLSKVAGESDTDESRVGVAIIKKRIRERLTGVAVDVITDTHSVPRREAHRMLSEGTWTDRPRARVYLGGPEVPGLSVLTRLRDWASGKAYERQVQATVEELAEMAGVETGDSIAPDPAALVEEDADVFEGSADELDLREAADALGAEGVDHSGLYRPGMFDDEEMADLDLGGETTDGPAAPDPASAQAVQTDGAGDETGDGPSSSGGGGTGSPTDEPTGENAGPTDERDPAVETGGERT